MGKKVKLIEEALHHHGIVITAGIPEHIIEHLGKYGYKIKKNKRFGHPSTLTQQKYINKQNAE